MASRTDRTGAEPEAFDLDIDAEAGWIIVRIVVVGLTVGTLRPDFTNASVGPIAS